MVRVPLDEADFAMSKVEKIAGHLHGRRVIVDTDVEALFARRARRHGDHRNAHRIELRHDRLRFRQWRREDDPLDFAVGEAADHFRLLVGVLRFAGFDDEVHSRAARRVQSADQEFSEIAGARVGVEQSHMRGFAGGEAARGGVGRVVQLLDRLEHGGPRRFAHIAAVVDDARDGHRRHARGARDVLDRHGPPSSAARSRHPTPLGASAR